MIVANAGATSALSAWISKINPVAWLIHDEPFDFNAQTFYPKGDIVLKAGDTVETRCYYDNDTSQTIHFGERTQDEMCCAFVAAARHRQPPAVNGQGSKGARL